MSTQNQDNKTNIDNYIENNPHCILELKSRTEIIDGESVVVPGYRLPLELIFYNIENGRFASQYTKLVRKNGGKDLDSTKKEDAKEIQKLLLELNPEDTNRTYVHLQKGQTHLGLITQDGFLIDGNRRMSIISKLFEDKHDPKYGFIEVAKLDRDISKPDLWAIEAGISLGMDPKVRYGPINELLKLEKGIKSGFTPEQIADLLYGGDAEVIKEKLSKLDLMKEYLRDYYDGDDEDFSPLTNLDTHFTTLQENNAAAEEKDIDIEEKQAMQKVGFRLIREKINHRRMRDIAAAIKRGVPLEKLVESSDKMETFTPKPDDDNTPSSTEIRFMDFEDLVKANRNSENSIILLNSILSNLEAAISSKDPKLKTDESKEKIQKIKNYVEKLISQTEI